MTDAGTKVPVKVIPSSSRNQVIGFQNEVWRIKIAAPADKGKANKELIDFLSKTLSLKKDAITILRGLTSHDKLISIDGLPRAEIDSRLSAVSR